MNIQIRNISDEDWDFIRKIRNQKSSREAFHDTTIASKEKHKAYMIKLRDNSNAFQWIVEYEGKSVGYIKIVNGDLGSFLLDGFKGKGVGTNAYNLVFEEAKKLGLKKIKATVKIDRPTPIKFEEKLGWKIVKTVYKNEHPYSYYIEKILD